MYLKLQRCLSEMSQPTEYKTMKINNEINKTKNRSKVKKKQIERQHIDPKQISDYK